MHLFTLIAPWGANDAAVSRALRALDGFLHMESTVLDRITQKFLCAVIGSSAIFAGACQTHTPRPLDLAAHINNWHQRTADSPEVVAFARQLEQDAVGDSPLFDVNDGLSLREAQIVALVFNPDLRLARLRAGMAAASAEHAGHWDDPTIGVGIERIVQSVAEPWVIATTISFTLPISGRLEAAKKLAGAEHAASLQQLALEEWQTMQSVRSAWLEWSALRLRQQVTDSHVAQLQQIAAGAGRLVEAGEMDRTQAALFDLELAQRRNEARRYAGEQQEIEAVIRGLLGLAPRTPLNFVPEIAIEPGTAIPGSPHDLAPVLAEHSPRLALRRAEYESSERALALEIRQQYPDLTLGPGISDDQGQSRLLLGLSAPLPIFSANRQAIAEAHAQREFARGAFATEYERLAIGLARSIARHRTAKSIREDLEANVAPLADRQLADSRRLAEMGELDPLVLLESIVRAHDTRLSLIEARLSESQAAVVIDEIIGPTGSEYAGQESEDVDPEPEAMPSDAASETRMNS